MASRGYSSKLQLNIIVKIGGYLSCKYYIFLLILQLHFWGVLVISFDAQKPRISATYVYVHVCHIYKWHHDPLAIISAVFLINKFIHY